MIEFFIAWSLLHVVGGVVTLIICIWMKIDEFLNK